MRPRRLVLLVGFAILGAALLPAEPSSAAAPSITDFHVVSVADLNLVTLQWTTAGGDGQVYVFGPRLYPFGSIAAANDVGFQARSTAGESHTVTFRAPTGTNSYTLEVHDLAPSPLTASRTISLDVALLSPPSIVSVNPPSVDPFSPVASVVTWSLGGDAGTVEVTKPDTSTVVVSSGSSYTISTTDQAIAGDVVQTWELRHCKTNGDTGPLQKVCSASAKAVLDRGGSEFDAFRTSTPSGTNPAITWNSHGGAMFFVRSPTLTFDSDGSPNETWATTHSISATANPPDGAHQITMVPCTLTACIQAKVLAPGTLFPVGSASVKQLNVVPPVEVKAGDTLALLCYSSSRCGTPTENPTKVVAQSDGRLDSWSVASGQAGINPGQEIGRMTPYHTRVLQVGESATWDTSRSWTADYLASGTGAPQYYPAYKNEAAGVPLDVTFAGSGDVFGVGEFQQRVSQMSSTAGLSTAEIPLFAAPATSGLRARTTPFGNPFDPTARSSSSALGERIIEGAPGDIWFAQGGAGNSSSGDHARIIRFRPGASQDESTPFDDRFCAFPVPGVKNHVYGLAWSGNRIWFVENRAFSVAPPDPLPPGYTFPTSAVTSFDPSTMPCTPGNASQNNLLDYSLAYTPAYCSAPWTSGCMTKFDVPGSVGFAQPLVDAAASTGGKTVLWVSEAYGSSATQGRAIRRLEFTSGSSTFVSKRYPVPTSSRNPGFVLGSFPWRLAIDANYVYFSEFFDSDLVRLTRSTTSACETLNAQGKNPCMNELHVPLSRPGEMNAIQLSGTKLYFAMDTGQVGFVDTIAWDTGTCVHKRVLYSGMSSLVETARKDVGPANYNGIALDGSGSLAISDFSRRQVIRLTPKVPADPDPPSSVCA